MLIAPSILAADFACLKEDIASVEQAGADWLHVDVMDGMFVPNLTMGPPVLAALKPVTHLPLDVHLMIVQPERYLQAFAEAGATGLTVHAEACPHLHRTLAQIRELGCVAGVSLNPGSPLGLIEEVIDSLDLILIMTVNPGFGGQRFIDGMVPKIQRTRHLIGERPIHLQVDGGIGPKTAPVVTAAGATVLVAGSAIFGQTDRHAAIEQLRPQLKSQWSLRL